MTKLLVYSILTCFFVSFRAYAQKDFVIGLKNDTLWGSISYDYEDLIIIDCLNRKRELSPVAVSKFYCNGKFFTQFRLDRNTEFAELILDGFPISILKLKRVEKKTVMIDGYTNPGVNESVFFDFYYWNKKTGKYTYIKEFNFQNQARRYFESDTILLHEIETSNLKADSMQYIVKQYNIRIQ